MPAVQRHLLDRLRRHDMPDDAGGAIEQRQLGPDDHGITLGVDGELEIADQRAADLEGQRVDAQGAKSRCRGGDLIRAGWNGRHVIASGAVAGRRAVKPGGGIAHLDPRVRQYRAGRVGDAALQGRRRLSARLHCE